MVSSNLSISISSSGAAFPAHYLQAQRGSAQLTICLLARRKVGRLTRNIGKLGGLKCLDLESAVVLPANRGKVHEPVKSEI